MHRPRTQHLTTQKDENYTYTTAVDSRVSRLRRQTAEIVAILSAVARRGCIPTDSRARPRQLYTTACRLRAVLSCLCLSHALRTTARARAAHALITKVRVYIYARSLHTPTAVLANNKPGISYYMRTHWERLTRASVER